MMFSQRLTDAAYFPCFRLRWAAQGDTGFGLELEHHGEGSLAEEGRFAGQEKSLPKKSHLHAPREPKMSQNHPLTLEKSQYSYVHEDYGNHTPS